MSCLAALVAAALATTPAAARSPVDRVTLGAVNVISGDAITGMEVRIPQRVTIQGNPFDNRDISYSGAGRIVGLALVEEGKPLRKAFQLVGVRWDFCGRPGCTSRSRDVLTSSSDFRGKRWTIPAGDYRLYLIADGAPVRVELRLDGLDGETSLRPSESVAGRIAAPRAMVNPTHHLFLGRARPVVMPAPGLLIDGDEQAFRLGPHYGIRGNCFWRSRSDDESLDREVPGPHCYDYSERGGYGFGGGLIGGGSAGWGIGNVPAGRWRSSYWSVDAGVNPRTRFLTLWLPYENLAR